MSEVSQSCPTLWDPMDCSLPGSSLYGILQARVLEWVAISFPGDLPNPRIEPRSPTFQADALTSQPPGHSFLQRIFRYNLNQIPHDYTVKVTNKFKGLDRIECLKNYGQRFITLYSKWWSKPFTIKRNAKRLNSFFWRGPTNSWEKKRSERQCRTGKIYPSEYRVPKNSKERLESLSKWSVQRNGPKQ